MPLVHAARFRRLNFLHFFLHFLLPFCVAEWHGLSRPTPSGYRTGVKQKPLAGQEVGIVRRYRLSAEGTGVEPATGKAGI